MNSRAQPYDVSLESITAIGSGQWSTCSSALHAQLACIPRCCCSTSMIACGSLRSVAITVRQSSHQKSGSFSARFQPSTATSATANPARAAGPRNAAASVASARIEKLVSQNSTHGLTIGWITSARWNSTIASTQAITSVRPGLPRTSKPAPSPISSVRA